GIFAFVLYDEEKDEYLVGRDHIGIIPLYQGHDEHGNYYVASEMKALVPVCKTISEFPPGCSYSSKDAEPKRYYTRDWNEFDAVKDIVSSKEDLTKAVEDAVKRQLMTDVPYGVLLSGGLDSSITSAIAKRFAAMRIEDDEKSAAW
ncbi:asparagine synthase-related protein, partial [Vibrio furnissii]|uniref:asparagine synthase-related protein n=1 Tax=Vibrio furnissii TaxID=29494 RepID=UPI001EEADC85